MPKIFPDLTCIHTVVFDFDGVFTNNKVWIDQNGRESVCCDRGDGLAFDLVRAFQKKREINAEFFILSKESNPVVVERAKKLKLDSVNIAVATPILAETKTGAIALGTI